ncbi:alpha-amylase family glycosyl hydrolase [Bacillus sp. B15-48]|uniref:alpha-amylase family glycosyl hydrolase n=1 Tax=Bacillus sp. B15-48 TaxID=1548601 RepID=UPI00193EFB69|nr:alpha-amylase family glycosyl hydrolase [Bacillus sp. B15-48]MBM4764207.1 alpha-amylase [Bacillus sp. B15-48]
MKKRFLVFIMLPFFLLSVIPVGAVDHSDRKWQDESIYYLMVDRFNNGDNSNDYMVDTRDPHAYHGGDFEGVIKQLDYLSEMGFTTILLSPIFENDENGYHGFFITDFYKTEEHLGDLETFQRLVQEAHKRNMKIVVDFIVNQVSPNHSWVNDSEKEEWLLSQEEAGTGIVQERSELPHLNLEHQEVSNYLLEAAKWWIEETDIDGYRLLDVHLAPISFWEQFSNEVKATKENFFLLGDTSVSDSDTISEYVNIGFDSFMDYPLNAPLRSVFAKPDQSFAPLFAIMAENETNYHDSYLLGQFMDNQDMVRFTEDMVVNNEHPGPRWRLALTYLYTTPGIPLVYYGSEIALAGQEAPDNRRQMNFFTDKELVDYISNLGDLRGKLPSLTRGSFELLYEQDGMAIFKREYEEETAVVVINNTSKTQWVTLNAEQLDTNKELRGILAGDLIRSDDNDEYQMVIDREEAEIYVLIEKTEINFLFFVVVFSVPLLFLLFIYMAKKRAKNTY